jgi:hypothetical protein
VNTLYCLEEWRGEQRISPPGDNFTPRGQNHPWGTTSPLGVKVFPRVKLRMGLCRTVKQNESLFRHLVREEVGDKARQKCVNVVLILKSGS